MAKSREFVRDTDGRARPIRTGITGQNYPGKRNFPHPRGERRWPATKAVSKMPSVASSGVTGPTRTMHPLVKNPAKFSRKMSISDQGTGGHGELPAIHRPPKPALIAGVLDKVPDLIDFTRERVKMARLNLLDILWRGE